MTEFFRYTEDGFTSLNMTVLRVLLIISMVLSYRLRNKKKLLPVSLALALIVQLLLLYWYAGNHALFIQEGLPLFHCRISVFMMLIAYIIHNDKLMRYFAWLGLIGGIIAFSFPDPSKYLWPHVTNITYVMGHLLLGFCSVMILSTRKTNFTFKNSLLTTTIMNSIIMAVNLLLHTNYGYLVKFPNTVPVHFAPAVTFLFMTMLMSVFISAVEKSIARLTMKKQTNSTVTMQE